MESLILIVHVLLAVAVIALILLQQGKGADMGASFGAGASQTVFGSSGSGNFLTRLTAVLATCFFVTSFGLAIIAKDKSAIDANEGIPSVVVEKQESEELPSLIEGGVLEEQPADASLPELD